MWPFTPRSWLKGSPSPQDSTVTLGSWLVSPPLRWCHISQDKLAAKSETKPKIRNFPKHKKPRGQFIVLLDTFIVFVLYLDCIYCANMNFRKHFTCSFKLQRTWRDPTDQQTWRRCLWWTDLAQSGARKQWNQWKKWKQSFGPKRRPTEEQWQNSKILRDKGNSRVKWQKSNQELVQRVHISKWAKSRNPKTVQGPEPKRQENGEHEWWTETSAHALWSDRGQKEDSLWLGSEIVEFFFCLLRFHAAVCQINQKCWIMSNGWNGHLSIGQMGFGFAVVHCGEVETCRPSLFRSINPEASWPPCIHTALTGKASLKPR